MISRRNVVGVTGLWLALALAAPADGQSTTSPQAGLTPAGPTTGHYHEGELGEKLMVLETALKCQCSCGLDLHSCQFQMQCEYSPAWSARIRESLAAGESVEAIQASFVADYGTQVLMMPPAEGFNLLGYFLPALAIVAASALVGMVARGGMTRERLAPIEELTDEDEDRLRIAMQKLEESESPDW